MRLLNEIRSSVFIQNIIKVSTGNSIARILGILSTPLLSRLYSPDDFGQLGEFTSVVSILAVFSTLRFVGAIPVERDRKALINLVQVCFTILVISTVLSTALIGAWIIKWNFVGLLVLAGALFSRGYYEIAKNLAIGEKSFSVLGKSKFIQSLSSIVVKLLFSLMHVNPSGLVLGFVVNEGAGGTYISRRLWIGREVFKEKLPSLGEFMEVVRKYRRYLYFQLPSQLLLALNNSTIVLFISKQFEIAYLGEYTFAVMIIGLPLSLIGSAIGDVFFGEITNIKNSKSAKILETFVFALNRSLLSFPMLFIYVGIVAYLFSFLFGEKWEIAPKIMWILCPIICGRFVTSPFMSVFVVYDRQDIQLKLNLFRLFLITLGLSSYWLISSDFMSVIINYSMCVTSYYILTLFYTYWFLKRKLINIDGE